MKPTDWKRNAGVFVASQILSLFGSSLVQYAITWHITLETQSGIYATISILCSFIPMFLLSPFAGVWADRYNKKLLIVLADGGIALCTLALAVSFMLGYDAIWLLFLASAVRSLGGAVQTPCINAVLPEIVPPDKLTRVNAINGSAQSLVQLASPMLAGALMGMASLQSIFFIDVVTAALAIGVLLVFLKLPHREKRQDGESARGYLAEMKAGLGYIKRHKYLKHIFAFMAVLYLLAAPVSFLTPLQVARTYGEGVWQLTAIEVTFGLGMGLGGGLLAAWGGFKNKADTIALSTVAMGLLTLVLGLGIPFWPYAGVMLLIGLFLCLFSTPAMVLLQQRVDEDYRGRVFSVMTMISTSVMPLGMVIFGPLADVVDIEWLLIASGLLMALLSLAVWRDAPIRAAGTGTET